MIATLLCSFAAAFIAPRPKLLVHVMPWFAAPPLSKEWGWHWTMGKLDPSKGDLATHFRPLIGPYDSGDPDVIECQTLLIKIAGFDGMLVDWYGDLDRWDYLSNHHVTEKLFDAAGNTGLSFALVYEDQTVPNLISGGLFGKEQAVLEGKALLQRAEKRWFRSPTYQKLKGKPLLMVFGPQYYPEADWTTIFSGLQTPPAFFTLHARKGPAVGGYDWPLPQQGDAESWKRRAEIAHKAKEWPSFVPCAYPRFRDFYKESGVSSGYGEIEDRDGATYDLTLGEALRVNAPFVQVATWNDWGEGTQIEPSKEFGYRDLEATQRHRKRTDPSFPFTPGDLRLPVRLYELRRRGVERKRLDAVRRDLTAGRSGRAANELARLGKTRK